MSIPVATTTITVERSSQDGTMDAFDLADAVWSVIASGVRAVIGSPSGTPVTLIKPPRACIMAS